MEYDLPILLPVSMTIIFEVNLEMVVKIISSSMLLSSTIFVYICVYEYGRGDLPCIVRARQSQSESKLLIYMRNTS